MDLFVFPRGGYPCSKPVFDAYRAAVKRHKGVHDGWEMFDKRLFYWWAMFRSRAARTACARDLKRRGFDSRTSLPKTGSNVCKRLSGRGVKRV